MEVIDICCLSSTGDYHKKSNLKNRERANFFHFRGLLMPGCRSPPFLSKNADKKEMEETLWQKNITFMSTDKGLKSASRYIKSTGETVVLMSKAD